MNMRRFHRILAIVVLIAGLGGSGLIYLTAAEDDSGGDSGYSSVLNPGGSKLYVHNMRVFGGMANVYADEFIRWFDGLWHGKSLAVTAACITVFVSAAWFYMAGRLIS